MSAYIKKPEQRQCRVNKVYQYLNRVKVDVFRSNATAGRLFPEHDQPDHPCCSLFLHVSMIARFLTCRCCVERACCCCKSGEEVEAFSVEI